MNEIRLELQATMRERNQESFQVYFPNGETKSVDVGYTIEQMLWTLEKRQAWMLKEMAIRYWDYMETGYGHV